MSELNPLARQQLDLLYANFEKIYDKTKYTVAVVFSDFISACFGIFTMNNQEDVEWKAVGLGGGLIISALLDILCYYWKWKPWLELRKFAGYMTALFLGSILGNLLSLVYDVGTLDYLYLTIGVLIGLLLLASAFSFAYIYIGERKAVQIDLADLSSRGRYKHPSVSYDQLHKHPNRPL